MGYSMWSSLRRGQFATGYGWRIGSCAGHIRAIGTSNRVPETRTLAGDELSADDAVTALRRYGRWNLVKNSFIRFRYADGFSNARALALQFCLSFIPLIIAVVGLSSALHHEKF